MVSLNYFNSNARRPLLEDDILRLNVLLKEAGSVDEILYAVIVDDKKRIRAHTDQSKIGTELAQLSNMENIFKKGDATCFNYFSPTGEHILNLSRPITFRTKYLGEIHIGISIDFIERLILEKSIFILIVTSIIIFFGIIVATLLGFHFSRPIVKLVFAAKQIGKGNYEYKINLSRNDEFGHLAREFNRMSKELWKKSLMQESFGKYVGPEVLEMILANPEESWLKGHRQEATMLFTDIRQFTQHAEMNEPEAVVEGLNQYFEIATSAILEYGGYIDKFVGDAVLGVFGVPVPHEDHIERAVRASLKMQRAFKEAGKNGNRLLETVGIGINSGVVVSGNIGSQIKMEYTVIGDSVNVASRLNGLAGPGETIVSKNIYEKLIDIIDAEALAPQKIKGKTELVETFKIFNIKDKNDVQSVSKNQTPE